MKPEKTRKKMWSYEVLSRTTVRIYKEEDHMSALHSNVFDLRVE